VSKLPRLANRNSHLRQRVSLGGGEVADEPCPLRFAAPRPAREDARPTENCKKLTHHPIRLRLDRLTPLMVGGWFWGMDEITFRMDNPPLGIWFPARPWPSPGKLRHRVNQPSRLTFRRKSVCQADVTKWRTRLVESNLHPEGVRQRGVVLGGGQHQGFLSGGHGVWESSDLGVSRRQRADNGRSLAAGKLIRLLGQLDRLGAVPD